MEGAIFPVITEADSKLPFILKGIGSSKNQEHIVRADGYPDFHWLHTAKGRGRLILENEEYELSQGAGFLMRPGIPHEYYAITCPWETHWITFNGYATDALFSLLDFGRYGLYFEIDTARLDLLLQEIYSISQAAFPYKSVECSQLVLKFMIELRYCFNGSAVARKNVRERVRPVIEFIEKNYAEDLSLDDMAAVIQVTPRHLCRVFREAVNMRPFDYLKAYRIKKAKEILISHEQLTINEIAKKAGFNSSSYFCSVFKAVERLTPLEFKQLHKYNDNL